MSHSAESQHSQLPVGQLKTEQYSNFSEADLLFYFVCVYLQR